MVGIKIKGDRYIVWCNDRWYETEKEPTYIFTKEDAENICTNYLPNHYVYEYDIIDSNGKTIKTERIKKKEEYKFDIDTNGFSITF